MLITLKIKRFTPGRHHRPRFRSYQVEVQPNDRLLDVLERIRAEQDPSLAYRNSCGQGLCGSDAMRVNGKNALACKIRMSTLQGQRITIEPLPGLPVIKDLVVDMQPFFDLYSSFESPLTNLEDHPGFALGENHSHWLSQTITMSCIHCGACTTACPIWRSDTQYIGPAALVMMHRYFGDGRGDNTDQRKKVLMGENGIWLCRNAYECSACCPQEIPITRAIAEIRKKLIFKD